jgi:hypothetical protein
MLYIEIPKGMKYMVRDDGDYFVSVSDENKHINIQEAVHEFYHVVHPKTEISGKIHGLTFHKKCPTDPKEVPLLEYRAKNTGKLPTDYAKVLEVRGPSPRDIATPSPVGRWIDHTLLSPARHEKAARKEEAQKLNRRKWGDSPNAN